MYAEMKCVLCTELSDVRAENCALYVAYLHFFFYVCVLNPIIKKKDREKICCVRN